MMNETWEQWHLRADLAQKYSINDLDFTGELFEITLTDCANPNNLLKIIYEDSVRVYRRTKNRSRTRTLSSLKKTYGDLFYEQWTFFRVQNSSYIAWADEEALGTFFPEHQIHRVFIGDLEMIDVLSVYEPRVELVNNI